MPVCRTGAYRPKKRPASVYNATSVQAPNLAMGVLFLNVIKQDYALWLAFTTWIIEFHMDYNEQFNLTFKNLIWINVQSCMRLERTTNSIMKWEQENERNRGGKGPRSHSSIGVFTYALVFWNALNSVILVIYIAPLQGIYF